MKAQKFLENHKTLAEQKYTLQDLIGMIAELVLIFTEGRARQTGNPYSIPEVKKALKMLAAETGAKDWMDVNLPDLIRR
jgi:altronate dehydratase